MNRRTPREKRHNMAIDNMAIETLNVTSPELLRVVKVDPQADERWEPFVAAHPEGTIYHHPVWLQVLEKTYGYRPACLLCEDIDGRVRGVFPLLETRGLITGKGLLSLPRTPTAGPIALDPRATTALLQTAVKRASAERGTKLQLKMSSADLHGLV